MYLYSVLPVKHILFTYFHLVKTIHLTSVHAYNRALVLQSQVS